MCGDVLGCAQSLCEAILEPLRTAIGSPIHISSGFRCNELNKAIGGSESSQHRKGQAVDIVCHNPYELATIIADLGLPYDQLIYEGKWVHVSHAVFNRGSRLTATFNEGKAHYAKGLHNDK